MTSILALILKELEDRLCLLAIERFRAKQIFSWIYKKNVGSFEQMTDLPKDLRSKLKENFWIYELKVLRQVESCDGTRKFLFALKDKNTIEAVIIPSKKRLTGCVSTQVGCKFGCKFCASAMRGFKRNLTTAEIVEEVLRLRHLSKNALTHLVFMGIGEPLDNYENVLKAIRIINASWGLNIGARKITISTCGIIPGIKKLATEGLQIELSVSLHAADEKTRNKLMPINKKYPLEDLIETLKDYIKKTKRQVTFEYVLIDGINADVASALNLVKLLKGMNCKLNLIPCNPVKELGFFTPKSSNVLFFKDTLLKNGIPTTLRLPRGRDIQAACGQLRLSAELPPLAC